VPPPGVRAGLALATAVSVVVGVSSCADGGSDRGSGGNTGASGTAQVSPEPSITHAGPPVIVCGQSVAGTAAGPVIHDLTEAGRPPGATRTTRTSLSTSRDGTLIFLRLSSNCDSGVHLTGRPASALSITYPIRARDGGYVLVELQVNRTPATLLVARPDGHVDTVLIT
jgi:hypothetical protein